MSALRGRGCATTCLARAGREWNQLATNVTAAYVSFPDAMFRAYELNV